MRDSLVDYAVKNIWCNPRQDSQFVLKPKRISAHEGVTQQVRVLGRLLKLPNTTGRWHLYQIGQASPDTFNIYRDSPDWLVDRWVPFYDTVHRHHVFMQLYSERGVVIPGHKCWTMYMDERNIIVAVEEANRIPFDYRQADVYLRIYQNAYFESIRATGDTMITASGGTPVNIAEILALQTRYLEFKTRPGYCFSYVNGLLVDSIDLYNVRVGDQVEMIHDASVARVVTFQLKNLPTFVSEKDSSRKYLLSYPFTDRNTIEYFDDQEIFVVSTPSTRFKGVYVYRHDPRTVRMVTHRDYSLSVSSVLYLTNHLKDLVELDASGYDDLAVRLIIRKAGYERTLVYENSRMHELYKLDYDNVLDAVIGTGDTLPMWRCSALENSPYTALMAARAEEITREHVVATLGYNAMSCLMGYTPVKLLANESNRIIALPELLRHDATIYEYDGDGLLIDHYHNHYGVDYIPRNSHAVYFEALRGYSTDTPEVIFSRNGMLTVPTACNWRLYKSYTIFNDGDNIWEDITDSGQYQLNGSQLVHGQDDAGMLLMLRTDRKFLAYDLEIPMTAGVLRFPLMEQQDRSEGLHSYIMPVPAGELDIFMNGRSLIEGIDYIVHFPNILICNKIYLNQPAASAIQKIHVRYKGLAHGASEKADNTGFIEHGVLSNNRRFDIRDDRVMRIVSGGSFKTRDDMVFSELHPGVSIVNALNGQPYMIKDIVVPLREVVDVDTYVLRDASRQIDHQVSDYLTQEIPEPARDALSAITHRHILYSPFISRLLYDIVTGGMASEVYTANLSDQQIMEICQPYEQWLDFDPIKRDNWSDNRYVVIHPHQHSSTFSINLFAYRFMLRVIKLYAEGLVDLSAFVTVEHAA